MPTLRTSLGARLLALVAVALTVSSLVSAADFQVLAPRGYNNAVLRRGGTTTVSWTPPRNASIPANTTDPDAVADYVRLVLLQYLNPYGSDGNITFTPTGQAVTIAASQLNNGSYIWTIPTKCA